MYVAGPLFTPGQRLDLERIAAACERLGLTTFLPHRDAGLCPPDGKRGEAFFKGDRDELDRVDAVVAVLNGFDVDAGTAWEIGYAYARSVPILGIYEDTRISDPLANLSLMVLHSLSGLSTSVDELLSLISPHIPDGSNLE